MLIDRVFHELHAADSGGLTKTQRVVLVAIMVAVLLAIVGTEPALPTKVEDFIEAAEFAFGVLFAFEYCFRVWSIGALQEFKGLRGRVRYMLKPMAVVDAVALVPFLVGALGGESLLLRLIRVFRLAALSKALRYSRAMQIVMSAVYERRYELYFAVTLAGVMILLSSAALYVVEGDKQPEAFGSILRSMWWSVVTLTTVGYGDVVPVTVLGKIFAAMTAVAGIGMIAMPTGILAASFSEGFARARAQAGKGDDPLPIAVQLTTSSTKSSFSGSSGIAQDG